MQLFSASNSKIYNMQDTLKVEDMVKTHGGCEAYNQINHCKCQIQHGRPFDAIFPLHGQSPSSTGTINFSLS